MAGIETDSSEHVEMTQENDNIDGTQDVDSDKSERVNRLPFTRIKHLIKLDPDVNLASQDAVVMIAKAAELFVQDLAKEAYVFTKMGKRKTVQRKDLDNAIERVDELAFLEGTLDS